MKYIQFLLLISVGCVSAQQLTTQASLNNKKEEFQKLIRIYQDSLADLEYVIGQLDNGRDVDFTELWYYRNEEPIQKVLNSPVHLNKKNPEITSSRVVKEQIITAHKSDYPNIKSVKSPTYSKYINPIKTVEKVNRRSQKRRVGTLCNDGTRSSATGRGACSHHGGVNRWIVQ